MSTYEEIKEMTINWCEKLKEQGVFNQDKYDKCLAGFVDIGVGQLPPDLEPPKKGNEQAFSLYNRKNDYIGKKMFDSPLNKITIYTSNKLFLGSNDNGEIYLINKDNINNQSEVEWTLEERKNNEYALKSVYGSYLSAGLNRKVMANRKVVDSETLWIINRTNGKITLKSVNYKDEYLTPSNPVKIMGGVLEIQNWVYKDVPYSENKMYTPFSPNDLHAKKDNLLSNVEMSLQEVYKLSIEINNLSKLLGELQDLYNKADSTVRRNLNKINRDYFNKINDIFRKSDQVTEYKVIYPTNSYGCVPDKRCWYPDQKPLGPSEMNPKYKENRYKGNVPKCFHFPNETRVNKFVDSSLYNYTNSNMMTSMIKIQCENNKYNKWSPYNKDSHICKSITDPAELERIKMRGKMWLCHPRSLIDEIRGLQTDELNYIKKYHNVSDISSGPRKQKIPLSIKDKYKNNKPFTNNKISKLQNNINDAESSRINEIVNMVSNLNLKLNNKIKDFKKDDLKVLFMASNLEKEIEKKQNIINENNKIINRQISEQVDLADKNTNLETKYDKINKKEILSNHNSVKSKKLLETFEKEYFIYRILLVVILLLIAVMIKKLFE